MKVFFFLILILSMEAIAGVGKFLDTVKSIEASKDGGYVISFEDMASTYHLKGNAGFLEALKWSRSQKKKVSIEADLQNGDIKSVIKP